MEPRYRDAAAAGRDDAGGEVVVLDVDGELFELSPDSYAGTNYSWLSGPNPGYGFGVSPTLGWSVADHRASIRSFLSQVDPATGYLADD